MQNDMNGKVTPLKDRSTKADATPEDSELMEAATAHSRPKHGLARALALPAAMGRPGFSGHFAPRPYVLTGTPRWNSRTPPG